MRLIDFIERDYRHMSEVTFEIVEHLGVLSEDTKGWQKEVNIVIWNGGAPKVDIRSWGEGHERMSRGITLTMDEADNLAVILDEWIEKNE